MCGAQVGGLTLWVKRTGDGTQYDDIAAVPSETVAQFKRRWVVSEKLDVTPSLVSLCLVKCGARKPSSEEEKQAVELDDPRLSLAEAGITDGCSLLAFIASSAPRSPCPVSIFDADSGHATGLGTVLPVDAPGVCTARARAL